MSTRNFIGSGQTSAHPLLDDRWIACSAMMVDAYLTRVYTVYREMRAYANGICVCGECHVMILVSWIETLFFNYKGSNYSYDTTEMV